MPEQNYHYTLTPNKVVEATGRVLGPDHGARSAQKRLETHTVRAVLDGSMLHLGNSSIDMDPSCLGRDFLWTAAPSVAVPSTRTPHAFPLTLQEQNQYQTRILDGAQLRSWDGREPASNQDRLDFDWLTIVLTGS